jgi:microcystin degradation protein MlrC
VKRVLLAGFKQESAVFNPVLTRYEDFHIRRGEEIPATLAHTRTEFGGALAVLAEAGEIEILPAWAGWAISGGPVAPPDLERLLTELTDAIRAQSRIDGVLLVLHGAMAGEQEDDPEGRLLVEVRRICGQVPLVASLDLHAVLTEAMVTQADVLVPFHTYPHVDQWETGARAARALLRLLEGQAGPTPVRISLPMLVRGDELLTATGLLGQVTRRCAELEVAGALAAGVLIGNPFTDVPELRSNLLVTPAGDVTTAIREAEALARFLWENRERLVARLTPLDEAIRIASSTAGLTVFSDAADATSSGAPGDSNAVLRGLLEAGYRGRALLTLVDAPAVDRAVGAGVGTRLVLSVGGTLDPGRHRPLEIEARVRALSDGDFEYADGTPERAGPCAVLSIEDRLELLVTSRPVHTMDRAAFEAHGLDPAAFDLVVVKSPNGFRPHYEGLAAAIVPVDVPGATSANLRSLPYRRCRRPLFPLDAEVPAPFTD